MAERDKSKRIHVSKMRRFPMAFGIAAGVSMKLISALTDRCMVLSNFGDLTLAASGFLLLIAVFDSINSLRPKPHDELNRRISGDKAPVGADNSVPPPDRQAQQAASQNGTADGGRKSAFKLRIPGKLNALFLKLSRALTNGAGKGSKAEARQSGEAAEAGKPKPDSQHIDGLIEINAKSAASRSAQTSPAQGRGRLIKSVLYLAILSAGLLYYIFARLLPKAYVYYSSSVFNILLLLVFAFVAIVYLKMRKDSGTRPADKTSHGILSLLAFTALVYAALLAASAVLKLNMVKVLPWVHWTASGYFIIAIVMNILVSLMKKDVAVNFDYTLLPDPSGGGAQSVLDSDEIRSNFSLKSLWTIKYALRILPGALLFLGLIMLLSTCVYVVQPYQQAAVYRLGRLSPDSIVGEGLHFKLPWPVDQADIYDVDRVGLLLIGYESANSTDFLWTLLHEGGEYTLLTGDGSELVAVNMRLMYKIGDLYSYVSTYTKPEEVLTARAYEALMNRTVNTTLDTFLSTDRSSLSASLLSELSEYCKTEKLGIDVTQVIIESIHPPVQVADVYQQVVTASVEQSAIITRAKTQAEAQLIQAQQQYKTIIDSAMAEQHRLVSIAMKEMAVYYAAMDAYDVNPECYKLIKYLDTYRTVIDGNKVYVFSPKTADYMSKFIMGQKAFNVSLYLE